MQIVRQLFFITLEKPKSKKKYSYNFTYKHKKLNNQLVKKPPDGRLFDKLTPLFVASRKSKPPLKWWFALALKGRITGSTPKGALKV